MATVYHCCALYETSYHCTVWGLVSALAHFTASERLFHGELVLPATKHLPKGHQNQAKSVWEVDAPFAGAGMESASTTALA